MKENTKLSIQDIAGLLARNGFTMLGSKSMGLHTNDGKQSFDITWGHSEIRVFARGEECVCVQYQKTPVGEEVEVRDLAWSFIFQDLPLHEDLQCVKHNFVPAKTSMVTYGGFETIEDVISLCRFAAGISLAETNKAAPIEDRVKLLTDIRNIILDKSSSDYMPDAFICNIASTTLNAIAGNAVDYFYPAHPELHGALCKRRQMLLDTCNSDKVFGGGLWPPNDYQTRLTLINKLITELENKQSNEK